MSDILSGAKLKIKHNKKTNTLTVNGVVVAESVLRLVAGKSLWPDQKFYIIKSGHGVATTHPVKLCKRCVNNNWL